MLLRELFKAKEDSLQEFDLGSVWTGIKTLGKGLLSAPAAAAQIALTPSDTAKYDTMDAASSVYQGALDKGLSGAEAEKLAQDFEKSLKANPNDPKVKQIHSQYAAWDDNFNEIPGSTKVAKPATDIKPDLVVKPKVSTAPVDDPTTKIPQISKSEKPVDPKDFEKAIAGNDVRKVSDAIPNVVTNTMAADKLATQTFKNPTEIEQGIKSVVGNKMPASNISALAATAAKYAIPAAGVVALLYGGKKLYDYLTKEESMKNNESQYTPTRDKEDYFAKKKALQDLQADPNTAKDPELQKELIKRKKALDKDTKEHLDLLDIIKLAGMEESATAGATSSANIATVANPHLSPGQARGKKSYTGSPWGGKSGTKAPPQPSVKQPKKSDGTAKNALDMKNNIFGENPIRR